MAYPKTERFWTLIIYRCDQRSISFSGSNGPWFYVSFFRFMNVRLCVFIRSQRSSTEPKNHKSKKNFSLPRLALGETETPGEHSAECECCHDVNVRREKRHLRPKPWSESHPVNEMITENVVETPGKSYIWTNNAVYLRVRKGQKRKRTLYYICTNFWSQHDAVFDIK